MKAIYLKWVLGVAFIAGLIYYFRKKSNSITPVRLTSINGKNSTSSIIEKDSNSISDVFNKIFNPTEVGTTINKSDLFKPPQPETLNSIGLPEPFKIPEFLKPAKIVISPEDQRTFDPPMQVKTLPNPVFKESKYVIPGKSTLIEVPKVIYPGRLIEKRTVEATVVSVGGGGNNRIVKNRNSSK